MGFFRTHTDDAPVFRFLILCSSNEAFRIAAPVMRRLDRKNWNFWFLLPVVHNAGEDTVNGIQTVHRHRRWRSGRSGNGLSVWPLLLFLLWDGPLLVWRSRVNGLYTIGNAAHIAGTLIGAFCRKPIVWHMTTVHGDVTLWLLRAMAGFKRVKNIFCASEATAALFEGHEAKVHVLPDGDPAVSAAGIIEHIEQAELR